MPNADNEICISKHNWENLKELSKGERYPITDYTNLEIIINDVNYKLVGIVDDNTDLSKYENMDEQELLDKSYTYRSEIGKTFAKVAYVSENVLTTLSKTGNTQSLSAKISETSDIYLTPTEIIGIEDAIAEVKNNMDSERNSDWWDYEKNRKMTDDEILEKYYWYDTIEEFINDYGEYQEVTDIEASIEFIRQYSRIVIPSGKSISNLADNEIIVPSYYLEGVVADYSTKIITGLYLTFKDDYGEGDEIVTLKVVGTSSNSYYMSNSGKLNTIEPITTGYTYILSSLNGSSEDKAFVAYCETYGDNGIKFAVQNSATTVLDMLESIIDMMTSIFTYVAIAFAVFASLMLMNFISTSITYKKREIGVLRALGARGSDIFGIFFNESTVISFINFLLAAIATVIGCNLINVAIIKNLGYQIALLNVSIRQIVLIFAISWGSAFLASLIPSLKISKKKPIDAINNR